MGRFKTVALGIFNCVRYILSDKYRQGFEYCDKCYRSALNTMYEVMVEERHSLYEDYYKMSEYKKGMYDAYGICLRKVELILKHIGEYHER